MHMLEPLVSEPSSFEVQIAIEKPKRYKSLGTALILVELIQAGGNTLHSKTHNLVNSVCFKEEPPHKWIQSIIVPIYKNGDKTDCSNYK
jgi:hypothetical protein